MTSKYIDPSKQQLSVGSELPLVILHWLQSGPGLPVGYVGLSLGPQDPRDLQQTVVRIESMVGTV